jgi:hypothetical protein
MDLRLAGFVAGAAFLAAGSPCAAHHSFAMFDQDKAIEVVGVVQEFKFTNPHTFILLEVREEDGSTKVWNLEGQSPSGLVRDGWTSRTLKPGDELKLIIWPLRSGAPGGAWQPATIHFRDGRPLVDRP